MAENNSSKENQPEKNPETPKANSAAKAVEETPKPKPVVKTAEELAQEAKAAAEKQEKADREKAKKEAAEKQAAYEKSKKMDIVKHDRKSYVPEPGSEGNYHAKIERQAFDPLTGERQSRPAIQIFPPKAFEAFKKNSVGLGYHVEVLHDPTGEYPECGLGKALADAKKKKAQK